MPPRDADLDASDSDSSQGHVHRSPRGTSWVGRLRRALRLGPAAVEYQAVGDDGDELECESVATRGRHASVVDDLYRPRADTVYEDSFLVDDDDDAKWYQTKRGRMCTRCCLGCFPFVLYFIIVCIMMALTGKNLNVVYTGGAQFNLTCTGVQQASAEFSFDVKDSSGASVGMTITDARFTFKHMDGRTWGHLDVPDELAVPAAAPKRITGAITPVDLTPLQDFLNEYLAFRVLHSPRPNMRLHIGGWVYTRLLPFPLPVSTDAVLESPMTHTAFSLEGVAAQVGVQNITLNTTVVASGFYVWHPGIPVGFNFASRAGDAMAQGEVSIDRDGKQRLAGRSDRAGAVALARALFPPPGPGAATEDAALHVRGDDGPCILNHVIAGLKVDVPLSLFNVSSAPPAAGADTKDAPFAPQLFFNRAWMGDSNETSFAFHSEFQIKRAPNASYCDADPKPCECSPAEGGDACTSVNQATSDAANNHCQAQCGPADFPFTIGGGAEVALTSHPSDLTPGSGPVTVLTAALPTADMGLEELQLEFRYEPGALGKHLVTPLLNTLSLPSAGLCVDAPAETWLGGFLSGVPQGVRCFKGGAGPGYSLYDLMLSPQKTLPALRILPPMVDRRVVRTTADTAHVSLKQSLPNPGPIRITYPFDPASLTALPDVTLGTFKGTLGDLGTVEVASGTHPSPESFWFLDVDITVKTSSPSAHAIIVGRAAQLKLEGALKDVAGQRVKVVADVTTHAWQGLFADEKTVHNPFPVDMVLRPGVVVIGGEYRYLTAEVSVPRHRLTDNVDDGQGAFAMVPVSVKTEPVNVTSSLDAEEGVDAGGTAAAVAEISCPLAAPSKVPPGVNPSCICDMVEAPNCLMLWRDLPDEVCEDDPSFSRPGGLVSLYETCPECLWCVDHGEAHPTINLA